MEGLKVVVKKKGSYVGGHVVNGKFVQNRRVRKLSGMRDKDSYVTLKAYLKATKSVKTAESILSALKVESVYVYYPVTSQVTQAAPEVSEVVEHVTKSATVKAIERQWWKKFHPTCITCTKGCKQSHMMLSVYCPSRVVKK